MNEKSRAVHAHDPASSRAGPTQWRMQLAAGLLAEGDANVGAIAYEVGYGSEAAFSRAFKKLVGVPPAVWRERSRP